MSDGKNAGNDTFAALSCTIFRKPCFRSSLKFFGTSSASFFILSAILQKRVARQRSKPRFGAALVLSAHDCETR